MNDKEKKIQEQRTLEATKKNLMGAGGKLGCIVRNMGQPIIGLGASGSGGMSMETNYLDDPFYDNDDEDPTTPEQLQDKIPYMDGPNEEPLGGGFREERTFEREPFGHDAIGWVFDGLNRGMHLEIQLMTNRNELVVYYQGYLVFKEVAGDLNAYVPGEWENKVDELFGVAKKINKGKSQEEKAEQLDAAQKNKDNWFVKMRDKWGL